MRSVEQTRTREKECRPPRILRNNTLERGGSNFYFKNVRKYELELGKWEKTKTRKWENIKL